MPEPAPIDIYRMLGERDVEIEALKQLLEREKRLHAETIQFYMGGVLHGQKPIQGPLHVSGTQEGTGAAPLPFPLTTSSSFRPEAGDEPGGDSPVRAEGVQ